jgi:hypothetical protein
MLPSTILISEAWGLCSRQQALAKGLCRDDRKTIPILVVPKGIPLTYAQAVTYRRAQGSKI